MPTTVSTSSPERKRKLSEIVAESLLSDIVEKGWEPGRKIGTEADLIKRFSVSRATIREAVRQLEGHGAVTMRRGAGGGLTVSHPPRGAVVRAMAIFIELTHVDFDDQHALLEQLELMSARLAAQRATDESISLLADLTDEIQRISDLAESVSAAMRFRLAMAEATENPSLSIFIEALNGVLYQVIRVLSANKTKFRKNRDLSKRYKAELLVALRNKDADLAEHLTQQDIERRLTAMRSLMAGSKGAFSKDGARTKDRLHFADALEAFAPSADPPPKRSEEIAQDIARYIVQERLEEGDNIGNELELQERYSVSRAILREAIRQLEPHGIIRTQSGFNGGIVVGTVNMEYTVELVHIFLRSTKIAMRHLWEVQSCLEVFAAGRLAQTATKEDIVALREVLDEAEASSHNNVLAAYSRLHLEIAMRAGSRALALFIAVLIRRGLDVLPEVKKNNIDWMHEKHRDVVDAIDLRDEHKAKAIMSEIFS